MFDEIFESIGKTIGWIIIIIVLLVIFFSAPIGWALLGIVFLALKMIK
jgi:hypothetical protein